MEINLPPRPVVVVGSGLAGLSCALQCIQNGANVVIVERNSEIGGNSVLASTGINGILPGDDENQFLKDTIESATTHGKYPLQTHTYDMIKVLVEDAAGAVVWLNENGVQLVRGHGKFQLVPKKGKIGAVLIDSLEMELLEISVKHPDRCAILTDTEMIDFIGDGSDVKGIVCQQADERIVLNGPVVLATGGFGSMPKFISKFRPDLIDLPKACLSQSTGHIADEAARRNAELTSMENYQLLPTGLLPFNEQNGPLNQGVIPHIGMDVFTKGTLVNEEGVIYRPGDKIDEELCKRMDGGRNVLIIPENKLSDPSIQRLGPFAEVIEPEDLDIGIGPIRSGPLLCLNLTPLIMIPLGGLMVNPATTQVEGLSNCFASGETVGGIHGKQMIVGSSLLSCVVFGRRAAQSATKLLLQRLSSAQMPATKRARRRLKQLRNQLDPPSDQPLLIPDREFDLEEITKHNTENDCWLILKGAVLDLTKFVPKHPGGIEALVGNAGSDITESFEAFHDDSIVFKYAKDCIIGRVKGRTPTLSI